MIDALSTPLAWAPDEDQAVLRRELRWLRRWFASGQGVVWFLVFFCLRWILRFVDILSTDVQLRLLVGLQERIGPTAALAPMSAVGRFFGDFAYLLALGYLLHRRAVEPYMRARDRMTPRIGRPWPALLAAPVLLTLLLVCASEISWMALRTQFSVEPPSIALEPVQPSSDSASVALVQGLPQPFNDSEPPSVTHAPPVWLEISMTAVGSIATLAWLACFTVWCALPRRRLRDVYLAALLAVVIDQTIALALEMPLMAYIESDPDRSVEAMHRIYLVGGSAVGLSSIAIAAALAWTFLRRLQRDAVWPSKPRISPDDSAARA